MTRDNLFTALRSFRPSADRDPREDFITEAFAWLLRRHEGLAKALLTFFAEKVQDPRWPLDKAPKWRTQVTFGGGRLDMVADYGDVAVVCEHKVWSPLAAGQLDNYKAAAGKLWSGGCTLVLITASVRQHEQNPDVALTWAEVYRVIARWHAQEGQGAALVEDFLGLLADEGLAPPAPVSHEAILSYLPAKSFERSMLAVVREVMKVIEADWAWLYDRLARPGDERGPYLRGSRPEGIADGRLGVDLLHGWRPGVFLGVIIDGTDHRVKPSEPLKGPDFCLVLSFDPKEGSPSRDVYLRSPEFKRLQERLTRDPQGWDYQDTSAHLWHPLHLRRPILDVLRGTQKLEEQVERFITHGREAIDVLLRGGELEELRKRLG